jgi:hypothetical protein
MGVFDSPIALKPADPAHPLLGLVAE